MKGYWQKDTDLAGFFNVRIIAYSTTRSHDGFFCKFFGTIRSTKSFALMIQKRFFIEFAVQWWAAVLVVSLNPLYVKRLSKLGIHHGAQDEDTPPQAGQVQQLSSQRPRRFP